MWVLALDGVAQLVGLSSYKPKSHGFGSRSGCIREATDQCFSHINVSLSHFPLCLEPVDISLGEDLKYIFFFLPEFAIYIYHLLATWLQNYLTSQHLTIFMCKEGNVIILPCRL